MSKSKVVLLAVIVFTIGVLAGSAGVYALQQRDGNKTPATNTEQPALQDDSAFGDDGLSPMQMYEKLSETPSGQVFDMYYMKYLMIMRNNETAMARIAKERAGKTELKQTSDTLMQENDQLVDQLMNWQNSWGFSDH